MTEWYDDVVLHSQVGSETTVGLSESSGEYGSFKLFFCTLPPTPESKAPTRQVPRYVSKHRLLAFRQRAIAGNAFLGCQIKYLLAESELRKYGTTFVFLLPRFTENGCVCNLHPCLRPVGG